MGKDDDKPVSNSIAKEHELQDEARKTDMIRTFLVDQRLGRDQNVAEKPDLRWKWGFNLIEPASKVT